MKRQQNRQLFQFGALPCQLQPGHILFEIRCIQEIAQPFCREKQVMEGQPHGWNCGPFDKQNPNRKNVWQGKLEKKKKQLTASIKMNSLLLWLPGQNCRFKQLGGIVFLHFEVAKTKVLGEEATWKTRKKCRKPMEKGVGPGSSGTWITKLNGQPPARRFHSRASSLFLRYTELGSGECWDGENQWWIKGKSQKKVQKLMTLANRNHHLR